MRRLKKLASALCATLIISMAVMLGVELIEAVYDYRGVLYVAAGAYGFKPVFELCEKIWK